MRRLLAVGLLTIASILVFASLPFALLGLVGIWFNDAADILAREASRLTGRTFDPAATPQSAQGEGPCRRPAVGSGNPKSHEAGVGVAPASTATSSWTGPTPPSREALLRQVDTLQEIGASPKVVAIARQAVEIHDGVEIHYTFGPGKVH